MRTFFENNKRNFILQEIINLKQYIKRRIKKYKIEQKYSLKSRVDFVTMVEVRERNDMDWEALLYSRIETIKPVSLDVRRRAKAVWDAVFKPIDGLGRLEEILCDIAAAQDTTKIELSKRAILVLCSDNGIVEEGISQSSSSITHTVAENIVAGKASINQMAACCHTDVIPVDMGMAEPAGGCLDRRIAAGTKNFAKEPAMSRELAVRAMLVGMELVHEQKERGYHILGTGEMGIGNTTTTSALTSLLLRCHPQNVTGRGAGLSSEGLLNKCSVIERALIYHFGEKYICRDIDVLDMLACVGGFDLAGLAGVFLGGALYRVPVLVDGVISACAAVNAARLCPCAVQYMVASHLGKEPAHKLLLQELGLEPVIHGNLALGEGTGAVLLLPMLDMALAVYKNKETFEENNLEAYQRY